MPSFFDLLAQSSSTADHQGRFGGCQLSRHGRHDHRRRDHHEPFNFLRSSALDPDLRFFRILILISILSLFQTVFWSP